MSNASAPLRSSDLNDGLAAIFWYTASPGLVPSDEDAKDGIEESSVVPCACLVAEVTFAADPPRLIGLLLSLAGEPRLRKVKL